MGQGSTFPTCLSVRIHVCQARVACELLPRPSLRALGKEVETDILCDTLDGRPGPPAVLCLVEHVAVQEGSDHMPRVCRLASDGSTYAGCRTEGDPDPADQSSSPPCGGETQRQPSRAICRPHPHPVQPHLSGQAFWLSHSLGPASLQAWEEGSRRKAVL